MLFRVSTTQDNLSQILAFVNLVLEGSDIKGQFSKRELLVNPQHPNRVRPFLDTARFWTKIITGLSS